MDEYTYAKQAQSLFSMNVNVTFLDPIALVVSPLVELICVIIWIPLPWNQTNMCVRKILCTQDR